LSNKAIEFRVVFPVPVKDLGLRQQKFSVCRSTAGRPSPTYLAKGSAVLKSRFDDCDNFRAHLLCLSGTSPAACEAAPPSVCAVDENVITRHKMKAGPTMRGRSKLIAFAMACRFRVGLDQRPSFAGIVRVSCEIGFKALAIHPENMRSRPIPKSKHKSRRSFVRKTYRCHR
jgi:hypothetical protein